MTPVVIAVLYIYIPQVIIYLPALTHRPVHSGGGSNGKIQLPAAPLSAPETEQDGKLLVSKKGRHTKITQNKKARMRFLITLSSF